MLKIMNLKPSVHRTMMGTNVEALLVDVVGEREYVRCGRFCGRHGVRWFGWQVYAEVLAAQVLAQYINAQGLFIVL